MGHSNHSLLLGHSLRIGPSSPEACALVVNKFNSRHWLLLANVANTRGRLRNAGVVCGCVLSQGKHRYRRPHDLSHDYAKRRVFAPVTRSCMRRRPSIYPLSFRLRLSFWLFAPSPLFSNNRWRGCGPLAIIHCSTCVHDDALFTAKVRLSRTFHIWTTGCASCLHSSDSLRARVARGFVVHITLHPISPDYQRAFLSAQLSTTNLSTFSPLKGQQETSTLSF